MACAVVVGDELVPPLGVLVEEVVEELPDGLVDGVVLDPDGWAEGVPPGCAPELVVFALVPELVVVDALPLVAGSQGRVPLGV